MNVARQAADKAADQLRSNLIAGMLGAGEDPTDDTLWRRRKAEAIKAMRFAMSAWADNSR